MARLSGINVLVVGPAGGMTSAIAGRLVAEGAQVVTAGADGTASTGVGPVQPLALDVTSADSWQSAAAAIEERFGALHGVVNATSAAHTAPLLELSADEVASTIDANLLGPILGIQTMAPLLRRSGGGSIVTLASPDALRGAPNAAVFAATNWGLRGLTRSAAHELGPMGIRINTVCASTGVRGILADGPQERSVTMGDVAAMVAFLLSDDSATCTGGDFLVDAGLTA